MIKNGAVKCILNEGMPQYRNPFEKGKLIVQFLVQFPARIDPAVIGKLESLLPPRQECMIPDNAEEVGCVSLPVEGGRVIFRFSILFSCTLYWPFHQKLDIFF